MCPFFDETYETQRRRYYTAAVAEGFGLPVDAYRAVADTPGVSWHTSALGLTFPQHREVVPRFVRSFMLPVAQPARSIAESIWDKRRASGERAPPRLPPTLWLMERLPDDLFIRVLEWFKYPAMVLDAVDVMWQRLEHRFRALTTWHRYCQEEFWEAGRRFLGTDTDTEDGTALRIMRDRLRAGGLLARDREMLNMLALGAVGEPSPPPRWMQDLLTLLNWVAEGFRRRKPPSTEPDLPGQPGRAGLTHWPNYHVSGLELESRVGGVLLARSTFGLKSMPSFLFWPEALPSDLSPSVVLQEHAERWGLEHRRRQVLYRLGGTVLNLVLTYITMGPIGLIVSVLHLLAEGLLDVIQGGRHLIWPAFLPETI